MKLSVTPVARILVAGAVLASLALFYTRLTPPLPRIQAAERHIAQQAPRILSTSAAQERSTRNPILVELFTSEGCSSCPPADALLARLDHDQPVANADIIVLGEHVDYWDRLGWKDRFSSHDFTQRQTDYQNLFHLDDIYTPQTVVNGSAQFNGSDAAGIEKAIAMSASNIPVPLQFTGVEVHGNNVTFTVRNGPATPGYVNVYAALVDPVDTTVVRSGENAGRTLRHVGIVRQLSKVGSSSHTATLGEHPFTVQAHFPGMLDNTRLVVFLQPKQFGPVLGTVACSLGSPAPASGPAKQTSSFYPCPAPASAT